MYYSVGWPNKCSVGIYCRVWPRRGGLPPYNVRNHPALWLHTCQSMIPTWMRMAKIEISSGWWRKGFGSQNLNKSKQVLTACLVLWNENPDLPSILLWTDNIAMATTMLMILSAVHLDVCPYMQCYTGPLRHDALYCQMQPAVVSVSLYCSTKQCAQYRAW